METPYVPYVYVPRNPDGTLARTPNEELTVAAHPSLPANGPTTRRTWIRRTSRA